MSVPKRCAVDSCGRPHYAKTFCRIHWERNHINGDPLKVRTMQNVTVRERLDAHAARVGGCLEWTGRRDKDGYGQIQWKGHARRAIRVAWIDAHGPIPDGLVVRHKCDNPPCIDLAHLELGTHADNGNDKKVRGRSAFGERNAAAVLTAAQAVEIFRRSGDGESRASLALEFDVGTSTVSRIARRKSWVREISDAGF